MSECLCEPARSHLAAVVAALSALPVSQVQALAGWMGNARIRGRFVFTCGNGGSAATAAHFAVDLRKVGVHAFSLVDPAYLTAQGNDGGFETVFARQVEQMAGPWCILIAFSVSGTSPNVLVAIAAARQLRAMTILLTGQDAPAGAADLVLAVPSADYGVVEDAHLAVCHAVARAVREEAGDA